MNLDKRQKTRALRCQLRFAIFSLGFVFCIWSPIFGLASASADDSLKQFAGANVLYKSAKFQEAADAYLALSENASAGEKCVLYFNAANSLYRAGKLNEAVLNYERSLAINPWYSDARYNLRAVKARLEYKIEDRRNPFIRIHELALQWIKLSWVGYALLSVLLIFLISVAIWLKGSTDSVFWGFPRSECFAVFLLLLIVFLGKFFYEQHYKEAIIVASETDVRYGPSVDNQSLMKLGGGLKVYVVDEREDWSRVITWNGETGWIKNTDMGKVKA